MILNVRDFPTPDAALGAAVDGDTVYFPSPGPYSPVGINGWVIGKSISIVGDGPGGVGSSRGQAPGTTLQPLDDAHPLISIVPPVKQVHIRGVQLKGSGATSGAGAGIVCESPAGSPNQAADITLRDVTIRGFPGDGIRLATLDSSAPRVSRVTIADSRVESCRGLGLNLNNAQDITVIGVKLASNRLGGCTAVSTTAAFCQCAFDGNGIDASGALDANLKLDQCPMARVDGCRFVNIEIAGSKRGCSVNKGTAMISASSFAAGTSTGTQGILLTGTGGGPYAVMSQRFSKIATLVKADAGIQNLMLLAQYDDTATGTLNIAAGVIVFGAPHIVRASGSLLTGATVPSYGGDPTDGVRPGMLVYNTSMGKLRFLTAGQWKTVSTS